MSTLENRDRTAILVVDVQNGVVDGAHDRGGVVGRIGALVASAREASVPVVWVQHSADDELVQGSPEWAIVPELDPAAEEPVVHKRHGDSFEGTDLEKVLGRLRVGHLVVTGAESDACVRSTIHGAFTRGYDVTLVADAHTSGDKSAWGAPPVDQVIAHTNLYWRSQTAPGRRAAVLDAADVDFAG